VTIDLNDVGHPWGEAFVGYGGFSDRLEKRPTYEFSSFFLISLNYVFSVFSSSLVSYSFQFHLDLNNSVENRH
jgi:hypothetical protein